VTRRRGARPCPFNTYNRSFQPHAIFDVQDDLVPRIVCTVADTQGVLPRNMTDALRSRDPEQLSPYEAVLRSFGHFQRLNATEHEAARAALERAVQQPPDRGDCWAMLSMLYREEYTHGFNLRPDPIDRALAAARRAVDAAPTNHLAYHALASALFFRREFGAFRTAAERALVLNSMDGFTAAYLGFQIAYSGDWEHGCALAERSTQLNPNHPGWYWFPLFFNAYRQRDYRGALEIALKVNMPGFWRTHVALAAAQGQLGDRETARKAVQELLKIKPDFAVVARDELRKWYDADLVEHLIAGLRKGGLDVPSSADPAPSTPTITGTATRRH
jgi:adenylate cyclase